MHRSVFALSALCLLGCYDDGDDPDVLAGPTTEELDPADEARWRSFESDECTTAFERVGIIAEDVSATTTVRSDDTDVGCGQGSGVFVRGHDGSAFACALMVLTGSLPVDEEGEPLPPPSDYAEASLVLGRLDLSTGEVEAIAYDGGNANMDPATVTLEAQGSEIRCTAEGAGELYVATAEDPAPAPGTSGLIDDTVGSVSELALSPLAE